MVIKKVFFFLLFFNFLFARRIVIGNETTETVVFEEREYLLLTDFIKGLGAKSWLVEEKIFLILDDSLKTEIVIDLKKPIIKVNFEEIKVPYPILKVGNNYFLSLFTCEKILEKIGIKKEEAVVEEKIIIPEINEIKVNQKKDTTIIIFSSNTDVYFSTKSSSYLDYEINFQAKSKIDKLSILGHLKSYEIKKEDGFGIKFYLKKECDVRLNKEKNKVVLKFLPRLKQGIKLVVLDPGHGGKDPGAIGKMGTKEKDLNLKIAKKIKKYLEKLGLEVILTRNSDVFVSLGERAKIANDNKADLFISIHCNSTPRKNSYACGFEVFFLSEARTDWERAVAQAENEVIKYEITKNDINDDFLSFILADLAQQEFLKESQELAVAIQDAVCAALNIENRGVKQAGFYVLKDAFMPAVLIECGFLSNRKEEVLLRKDWYQEKLARAIAEGVKKFIDQKK
ncbi:MAG: N-acetylmuramoyl-L-alanine amidase [candidate division WOR-3 bacterium]|nr:N-acetylmuramoyl-L-alanine amidase [candidate division WOR-3 bacterium]MCX7836558.1 N-acetylmuramoyl-L-alanine amidase [candidate division WOR-3 bacterium]MDW8113903.1 N-acetylmuramoyl-L-alanine amidase [candidate division WOR-3 bacterium]